MSSLLPQSRVRRGRLLPHGRPSTCACPLLKTPTPIHSPFAQRCNNHRIVSDLVSDRKPIKSRSGFLSSSTAFKIEGNIIYGCVRRLLQFFLCPFSVVSRHQGAGCGARESRHKAQANVVCRGQRRKEPESQVKVWTLILYHWGALKDSEGQHDVGTLHLGTVIRELGQLGGHLETLSSLGPQFPYPKPLLHPEPSTSLSPEKEAPPGTLSKVWVTPSGPLTQLCHSLAG